MLDALIIGGGPAGATTALLLARAGRTVAVLEKTPFPRAKVCGEFLAAPALALLRDLGVLDAAAIERLPQLHRLVLWRGTTELSAPLPAPYARALCRERLDTLLLARAAECGATVCQPAKALALERTPEGYRCRASTGNGAERTLEARAVIAAHGSWESGGLPTQAPRRPPRNPDLLAFKAHFSGCALPAGAVVLAPFAGGYGGVLSLGEGYSTFACCVRRDALAVIRSALPRESAGASVLAHALACSERLRDAFADARRVGAWIGAGPLRPGARPSYAHGVFAVGNAAGEVHPLVGKGLSIAMESAGALSGPLAEALAHGYSPAAERRAARAYEHAWRRIFARRLRLSSALATMAMRPAGAAALLRAPPRLLTAAAAFAA